MSLDDVVKIEITALTRTPTKAGFGTPLVMAYHTVFPERVRAYTDPDTMIDDGFGTKHPAYLAVQALFAQDPAPDRVLVGREENSEIETYEVAPVSTNLKASYPYSIKVNGLTATYTSDATPTVAEIVAGLKIAVDALGENVTTTDSGTYLKIESDTLEDPFTLEILDRKILHSECTTADGSPDGIVADIVAVSEENNSWYCLYLTTLSKTVQLAAAAYIETKIKLHGITSSDDEILSAVVTDDIASAVKAAAYARSFVMYHHKGNVEHGAAGWIGEVLPQDPGSATWKFKTLGGITFSALTDTEIGVLRSKRCNFYSEIADVNTTEEGYTGSGEFIDIVHSVDFMRARLQEAIFARLANSKKIPYTDAGVSVIMNEIRAVLTLCTRQGILAVSPEFTVTAPLVATIPFADRAARLLPDVSFEGTLQGAIHATEVSGVVSV